MFDEAEISALADAWLLLARTDSKSPEYAERFWAFDWMIELERHHPRTCWAVILAIFDKDLSDEIIGMLAAGPLEELLAAHGAQFIDEVELRARQCPLFRRMLTGVWRNRMPEDIWRRVLVASDRERHPQL